MMMNRRRPLWFLFLFAACFMAEAPGCSKTSPPPAPPGVPTRLMLAAGSAYRITVDERGKEVRAGVDILHSINQELRAVVSAVDPDGAIHLEATFGKAKAELDLGASTGPQAKIAQSIMEALSEAESTIEGRTISVTIGPDGAVRSMEGAQPLRDAVVKSLGYSGMLNNPHVRDALNNLYSEEGLRERFATLFPPLPVEPVDVGGSWVRDGEISRNVPTFRSSTRYTVREWSGNHVLVDITQNIGPNPVPVDSRADNGFIRQELKGTGSGFLSIDAATGLATQNEYRFVIDGTEWLDSKIPGRSNSRAMHHEQSLRIMIESLGD